MLRTSRAFRCLENLLHVEYQRFLMGGENKNTVAFFGKTGVSNAGGKAALGKPDAGREVVKNQSFTIFIIENEEFGLRACCRARTTQSRQQFAVRKAQNGDTKLVLHEK